MAVDQSICLTKSLPDTFPDHCSRLPLFAAPSQATLDSKSRMKYSSKEQSPDIEGASAQRGHVLSYEHHRAVYYGCVDAWTVYSIHVMKSGETQDRGQAPAACQKRWFVCPNDSSPSSFISLMLRQRSLFLCHEGQPLFSRTSVGCVSVKEGGRGLVLDPQGHSAFRVIHCLGPLFVQFLQRAKGPTKGEGRCRAGVSLGARDLHLPSTRYHLQSF